MLNGIKKLLDLFKGELKKIFDLKHDEKLLYNLPYTLQKVPAVVWVFGTWNFKVGLQGGFWKRLKIQKNINRFSFL